MAGKQSRTRLSHVDARGKARMVDVSGKAVTTLEGFDADDVERAKNRIIADYIYAQDSQTTLARMYGAALTSGLTVEEVQSRPDRIRKVTPEAVREVAKRYLEIDRSVTGYLTKQGMTREEKGS